MSGLVMGFISLLFWLLFSYDEERFYTGSNHFLLPWIFLTALILATPSLYLWATERFDPFNPLVFAAWSYLGPAFGLGSLLLAADLVNPYFFTQIANPKASLPLALIYVSVGYVGLTVGFLLPIGRKTGERLSQKLPSGDWPLSTLLLPALVLLALGFAFYLLAWLSGNIGFQLADKENELGTTYFFMSLLTVLASFMLWQYIFRTKTTGQRLVVALVSVLMTMGVRIVLGGNRGAILVFVFLILMAFVYSGRRFTRNHGLLFGSLATVGLLLGIIYGTTFRILKASEAKMSLSDYVSTATTTLGTLTDEQNTELVPTMLTIFGSRLEMTSTVGVWVSNYERLKPDEEKLGIDGNIWIATWTAFIPRFIWKDKPEISNPRRYSLLYFNFAKNSFAITPMIDLLRNYGPAGVPVGMALLGVLLRTLYTSLVQNQSLTIGRTTAYYMLLTTVSYEGFYGTILPTLVRVGFVVVLGLYLTNVLVQWQIRRSL
ncbi:hypothetical protein [Spirosoma oryzicola]|uniref:hypothetical protein n=1 Tax=Spirosoma oryzicola TaxID=2898794 RepID=UPI001E5613CA|nr:hypothetical protein [Spirosoma oryzicola]UHG92565.1 hypothetical protein LQ777_06570 [Spirosoma oryzicola]